MIEVLGIIVMLTVLTLMQRKNIHMGRQVCKSRLECKRKLAELETRTYASTNHP